MGGDTSMTHRVARLGASARTYVGARASAFLPSDISGLLIWIRFDRLGLSDLDSITSVVNEGSGSNFAQAVGANQPTFRTAIQNGLSIARFDGTDYLTSDAVMSLAQPCTFYWVGQRTGNFSVFNVVLSQDPEALATGFRGPSNLWYVYTNPALLSEAAADNAFHMMTAIINAGSSFMRTDLSAESAKVLDAGDVVDRTWSIGATVAGAADLVGDLGELAIYSGLHTSDQQDDVRGYLRDKWGTP